MIENIPDWLKKVTAKLKQNNIPDPYMYYLYYDVISLEWDLMGFVDASFEIDLQTKKGSLHILNLLTEMDEEIYYDFNNTNEIDKFIHKMKKITQGEKDERSA